MKTIRHQTGSVSRRRTSSGWLPAILIAGLATLSPAPAATQITSVTPRDLAYVLDWDATHPPRDYHLIKGTVAVSRTGATHATTLRASLSLLDEDGTPVPLVAATSVTSSWSAPIEDATHTFDFGLDPDEQLSPDRRYRVVATLQERVLIGGIWRWMNMFSVPSAESAERSYFHFTNTADTDPPWNALARIESLSIARDWRVQTSTVSAYQQFRIVTTTRFARFDEPGAATATSESLNFQFRMSLQDDLGNSQPLTIPGTSGHQLSQSLATWQGSKEPAETLRSNLYYYFKPEGQLDPVNRLYSLTLEIWASPAQGEQPVLLSSRATAPTRLLDFNGTLRFGSTFTTTMASATRTATPYTVGGSYLSAEMALTQITKTGGDATYSGNLGTRVLRLWATGIATYNESAPLTLTHQGGAAEWSNQALQGIAYKLGPEISLTSSGATTGLRIDPLPAGMGISQSALPPTGTQPWGASLLSALPLKSGVSLNAAMAPGSSVVWSYPDGVWAMEESKPVAIRATEVIWVPSNGRFEFTTDGTVHHPETAMRAQLAAAPTGIPAAHRERRSNGDPWLLAESVNISPRPSIRGHTALSPEPGSNAAATMDFALGAGTFATHFPEASITTTATSGNRIYVGDDMIFTGISFLDQASVFLEYRRTDPNSASTSYNSLLMQPTGADARLNFTATGGLRAACATGGHALGWGRLADGRYAFSTDSFLSATFFMPGTFYPQGNLLEGISDLFHQQCPITLLLTGQVPNKWRFEDMERPMNDDYRSNGRLADYAGANLRVAGESPGFQGRSIICGSEAPAYPLKTHCRYYVRKSGVTGIHDAIGGPSDVSLFGFQATLSSYGLSFLDSRVVHSVTDGELDVPYPSDFTLPVAGLSFTASGTPDGGTPVVAGALTLAYWQAQAIPMGLEFLRTSETDPSKGVMAIESTVSLPSLGAGVVTFGKLGFHPDGGLIRPSENIHGITSRLRPPGQITFNGPVKPDGYERYRLTPVSHIYLNHYEGSGNPGDGFLNLAGLLDVAFFRDIQVHVQASANAATQSEVAILHLTGGWENEDGTFFDNPDFDAGHLGRPAGVSLQNYRTGASYRPHARRTWLDAVDFDYPLQWDTVTRTFGTADEFNENVDLLVLSARHNLDSLSAEQAAISFGASYDGIPQISVGNLLVNAIDDATGAISAIEKALEDGAQAAAGAALWGASEAASTLLNDSLDALVGPVIEQRLGPGIQAAVIDPLAGANGSLKPETQWDLSPLLMPGEWVCNELVDLGSIPQGANQAVTGEVQGKIQQMIDGIDVFIGPGGILEIEEGKYVYGRKLVFSLIDEIASPQIKNFLGIKPGNPAEDYIDSQTTALIAKYAPTLNSVRERLIRIRERLVEIQNRFNPNQMFAEVITENFNSLAGQWFDPGSALALGELLAEDLKDHLRTRYGGNPQAFALDDNRIETAEFLVRRIRDRLATAALASQLQTLFRQQIQDVQLLIDQSIGSAFSNFKLIIRDLVAEATGGLDDTINEFTDELNGLVRAAEIKGDAVIRGDTLSHLRLDASLSLTLDEPVEFHGYIEISQLEADSGYGSARDIRIGATDVPVSIMGSEADFDIEARIVISSSSSVLGLGGKFEMKEGGELEFESFVITELGASVMLGSGENFLAAKLGMRFESFRIAGGLFVGHSETLEPLELVDPDVASVINPGPITGIYIYGEAYMPIVDLGCFFRVSAGLGLGAFYFTENNTYGGKIKAAVDGEALCIVSVSGEVVLVGAKSDILRFKGRGKIGGRVGWCPFCVKFSKQVEFTYDDNNGFDATL